MLCYIRCVNKDDYHFLYIGKGEVSNNKWRNEGSLMFKPTFMHIFKAKHLTEKFKVLDHENCDYNYVYSVIPVLTYIKE